MQRVESLPKKVFNDFILKKVILHTYKEFENSLRGIFQY